MKGLIPTLQKHWMNTWPHLQHWLKPALAAASRQFWSAPGLVMTSFLLATAMYGLYCKFLWRRGKKFDEI